MRPGALSRGIERLGELRERAWWPDALATIAFVIFLGIIAMWPK